MKHYLITGLVVIVALVVYNAILHDKIEGMKSKA